MNAVTRWKTIATIAVAFSAGNLFATACQNSGVVKAGDGKTFPKTGDELTMHYTGWLARTETKFDSSVDKGKPFVFKVHAF